ncbi:hypothetical protein R80B4_00171 [Fibrobacteres bacterium R8-0-B4]
MGNKETLNLLIMANSNKRRFDKTTFGRCVAGVTLDGEWIRLVADKEGDSILDSVAEKVRLLTVVRAEIERTPLKYHKENAILLKNLGTIQDNKDNYLKNIKPIDEIGIFGNTSNQLSNDEMKKCVGGTLRYVSVDGLEIYDRKKAKFVYQGHKYENMSMTDKNGYAAEGTTRLFGKAHIVVSLPNEPIFNKFVAAIHRV